MRESDKDIDEGKSDGMCSTGRLQWPHLLSLASLYDEPHYTVVEDLYGALSSLVAAPFTETVATPQRRQRSLAVGLREC